MNIQNLYPGSWGSNCYLLSSGAFAAIVDPSADAATLTEALRGQGLTLQFILLTHGHFDHIVSIDTLRQKTGAPVLIHRDDLDMPEDSHKNAFYDFFFMDRAYGRPDRAHEDGDVLTLGNETIKVLHTPGHTRGSVCYLCNDEFLITGDTLFASGYGRFDLYGGDVNALIRSLGSLRDLPLYLPIYPGHGASVTLERALADLDF